MAFINGDCFELHISQNVAKMLSTSHVAIPSQLSAWLKIEPFKDHVSRCGHLIITASGRLMILLGVVHTWITSPGANNHYLQPKWKILEISWSCWPIINDISNNGLQQSITEFSACCLRKFLYIPRYTAWHRNGLMFIEFKAPNSIKSWCMTRPKYTPYNKQIKYRHLQGLDQNQ